MPGKATIRPSDEKQVSTKPPPPLAGVSEIACLCFTFSCSRMMITLSGSILFDKVREGKYGVLRAEDQNLPPKNTGLQRNTLEEFSSILNTVGALANQRQKLTAVSSSLWNTHWTADAATEPQILQRNESRDIHMPRGALNSKSTKNQIPAHSRRRRAIRTGHLVP